MTGFQTAATSTSTAINGLGQLKTKNESKEVVAENPSRLRLILTNTGAKNISLGLGKAAVDGKGIVLTKEGPPFVLEGYTGSVFAIAASEEPLLAYVEI